MIDASGQNESQRNAERRLRNRRIYHEWISGETQRALATKYGISQPSVARVCKGVDRAVMAGVAAGVEAIKKQQTARYEVMYREAMIAWTLSKKPLERSKVRRQKKGNVDTDEQTVERTTEERAGNSRYLNIADKCLTAIRRIWGAEQPVELEIHDVQSRAVLTTAERITLQSDPAMIEHGLALLENRPVQRNDVPGVSGSGGNGSDE